jgi:hypothetical protein
MLDNAELEIAKAAVGVARESVAKQQSDIRDLRVAAAALLTATAVVVSFLGGRALDTHRFPLLVAAGVVLFVLDLILIIAVLIPSRGRHIKEIAGGSELFELILDPVAPATDAYVRLTQTYDEIYDENSRPKQRLVRRLALAATLLVAQIGAWGAAIVAADSHPSGPAPTVTIVCGKTSIRATVSRHVFICMTAPGHGRGKRRARARTCARCTP